MFPRFFRARAERKNAFALYQGLVSQARSLAFYADFDVPDTLEGRFDMILLHLFLADQRLENEGQAYVRLRRFVQEAMGSDMDRSFRELGVGDMSVGKEMKKVGSAWMGRRAAYAAALSDGADTGSLARAVEKNIYRGDKKDGITNMVAYINMAIDQLAKCVLGSPSECELSFPEV